MDIKGVQLDRDSKEHLYLQLFKHFKEMLINNQLEGHQKLPPIRKMAKLLQVNNVTVVKAYQLLEDEGLVYKKTGSGTYVIPLTNRSEKNPFSSEELLMMNQGQIPQKENIISFDSATPDPSLFPITDVKIAINQVLDRDGGKVFGYQESQGYKPLRHSISQYLEKKGINCQAQNMQIVSGAQQGIDIIAKALLNYGDVVFTEEPTYQGAMSVFRSRGARIVSIPIRQDGINLDILEKKLTEIKPRFLYLMTSLQNPTAYCYSEENKKKLLEISRRHDLIIVEDDSFSELLYNNRALKPIRGLTGGEGIVYIKSFSKIFLPGFRIAFLLVPENLTSKIIAAKHNSDIASSSLVQRTFDLLIREGCWEKHLGLMRGIYSQKFNYFVELMQANLIDYLEFDLPCGGLNFWLAIKGSYNSDDLYKLARKEGVSFVPGSIFYPDGRPSRFFRLSIAALAEREMKEGIQLLARACQKIQEGKGNCDGVSLTPLM